jgi:hypothetical protein
MVLMRPYIGMTPDEMVCVFNAIYSDIWEKTKENIHWDHAKISRQLEEGKDVDISRLLLEMFESVMTAARDGVVTVICQNNEKICADLFAASLQAKPETQEQENENKKKAVNKRKEWEEKKQKLLGEEGSINFPD